MGDMGELWKDTKEFRKKESEKRKEKNYDNAIKKLEEKGVIYELKNGGIHIVIHNTDESKIDYYPTTGKYIIRDTMKKGRGIFNLLKETK